jgi:hypothetical protein
MGYSLLADAIVAVHVAYVSFVLFGQLAICLGLVLRSGWVRNFWFRASHLLAIAIVATEAIFNVQCPLTAWEDQLRTLAGQEVAEGSFIGRFLHNLMFFNVEPRVFTIIYIAFAVLVLGTFLLAPPRWPWSRKSAPASWRTPAHPAA